MNATKYLLIGFITLFQALVFAQQKGASPIQSEKQNGERGNTYAVVVGISDYQDPAIPDLRFADKDAEAFANFLKSESGGKLNFDHLKILINQHATMAQFANALDWLWEVCKEGDQAIVYFSGHGDVEKKSLSQPGFLLCWDAPARVYMAGGAFALPMLQEVVSTLSIQNKAKVLVITDACRSGKLAGSSVGGSQATAANLAKQFGNEIKIMSCQPNEYSIEGEQWGGGRGAFSYHLIDALYGLADKNNDQSVSLQEIGRYLEDHVSSEVAPVSQVPMIIGNRSEKLSIVNEKLLASIKSGKTNQMAILSPIVSKGLEDEILSQLDTSVRELYSLFNKSLNEKIFFEPSGSCAETFYLKLLADPRLTRLHSTMTRNYAAALQDDAQQILNNSSNAEIREIVISRKAKVEKYANYTRNLDRAIELLGQDHYMFSQLQARKLFFEAWSLALNHRYPDSIIGAVLIEKFKKALKWESDLPQAYLQIGMVYGFNFLNADSLEFYAKKAVELAPNWVLPYCNLAYLLLEKLNQPEKAKKYLDLANSIDSSSSLVNNNFGNYYLFTKNFTEAEISYKKSIREDSLYVDPYYNLACTLSLQGKLKEGFQYLESALKIGYDLQWIQKDTDLQNLKADEIRWNLILKKYFPDQFKNK